MKNLYKIFLSPVIITIINLVIQTPSYSHGLHSLLSNISFFSNSNASDHIPDKEIEYLGGKPITNVTKIDINDQIISVEKSIFIKND